MDLRGLASTLFYSRWPYSGKQQALHSVVCVKVEEWSH